MFDETPKENEVSFKEKIKSLQFPRKPLVVQKDANGSTQTYHYTSKKVPSGRIDCDIHPPTVIAKAPVMQ